MGMWPNAGTRCHFKMAVSGWTLDSNGRQQANQIITEFIEKYQTGHSDFAESEDIAFACTKLMVLSGKYDCAEYNKLSSLLWNQRGVQYSKVFPLIIDFHKKVNERIDRTQGLKTPKFNRIPLRDDELPF